jgi:dienelactone hydrolase
MKRTGQFLIFGLLVAFLSAFEVSLTAAADTNKPAVKDLNTPRMFPDIKTKTAWEERAKEIRERILVSCGLWPMPEKAPLNPFIFDRIERDGYSIEKVYFQTHPGFYLAGNLYRPLGKGRGPFPGVLNPHGHWANGRMADAKDGSVAARCISFARQGMVAFTYDMVGYNDTRFPDAVTNRAPYESHRHFGTNRTDQLWSISLMGLQTWNTVRALDFLESLPDVDRKRLACTGASGGGTQTFMLGAIDDRLAALAPAVMVSHTMQGGCSCENAPGLRVEYSNMEIAAAAAPTPQILVAATGDWTKAMMEVEGPAIEKIYRLFEAGDRLRYVKFDFGHNYNQTSREAVYASFGQWLLGLPKSESIKEPPYAKEPDADLRVFPDGKLPHDALRKDQFIESLKAAHREQWQKLVPRSQVGLERFKRTVLPAWKQTLQVEWPKGLAELRMKEVRQEADWMATEMAIKETAESPAVTAICFRQKPIIPRRGTKLVVLANSSGTEGFLGYNGEPVGLAAKLLRRGHAVVVIRNFSTGDPPDQFANFYTTYNRTKLQERVRDLLSVCAAAKGIDFGGGEGSTVLCGVGAAGLWALMAAPAADAVMADCNAVDALTDERLLAPDLFIPGLRNIGAFEGAAMLAAPNPLLLHNIGSTFPAGGIRSAYHASGTPRKPRIESGRLTDDSLVDWLSKL